MIDMVKAVLCSGRSKGLGAGAPLISSGSAATCWAIRGKLFKRLYGLWPTQKENRISDVVLPHLRMLRFNVCKALRKL